MSCTKSSTSVSGINLPILLYNGYKKYPSVIHNLMENLFDTEIRKLNLTQHDFRYLCSLIIPALSSLNLNGNGDTIIYKYHIPGRPRSECILFDVKLQKLLGLWNRYVVVLHSSLTCYIQQNVFCLKIWSEVIYHH